MIQIGSIVFLSTGDQQRKKTIRQSKKNDNHRLDCDDTITRSEGKNCPHI